MRRLVLLLPLLPSPALGQGAGPSAAHGRPDAFCNGLRQLVGAAASGFDYLPRDSRLLPGSIEERRGITRSGDGPPRAVFYAVMLREAAREGPNPAAARFRTLQAEITRCLPDAQAAPAAEGQGGAVARWSLPTAIVGLRRDDGAGFASSMEVEVSVAPRW